MIECVLGSENFFIIKNDCFIIKCKCVECGIMKIRFIKIF